MLLNNAIVAYEKWAEEGNKNSCKCNIIEKELQQEDVLE
jgi:hypothetical protein